MTLIAYDSARPSLIPANPAAVFPYGDGHFSWSHKEFPRALYRYFTVKGDPDLDIADVEPGCMWPPSEAWVWAKTRLAQGHRDLTVYCDRSTFPAVKRVMAGLDWHLGLATLDGTAPSDPVWDGVPMHFCQYTDHRNAYDLSVVYDRDWLNKP